MGGLAIKGAALGLLLSTFAEADEIRVAVASNFRAPLDELAQVFEAESGHRLTVSAGSTGQLFAQIVNGAPYDMFLAADADRPARAEAEGLAVAGSRFTYAFGRLVLLARDSDVVGPDGPDFTAIRTLSIANPRTAPYGAAAEQILTRFDLPPTLRLAHAQNVAGVHSAVASGAADAGIGAGSTVSDELIRWLVPAVWHAPIRQDAVLLSRAADLDAARELLAWLRSPAAREIIQRFGYDVE